MGAAGDVLSIYTCVRDDGPVMNIGKGYRVLTAAEIQMTAFCKDHRSGPRPLSPGSRTRLVLEVRIQREFRKATRHTGLCVAISANRANSSR